MPKILSPLFCCSSWLADTFSIGVSITRVAYGLTAVMIILLLGSVIVSYVKAGEVSTRPPIGKAGVVGSVLAVVLSLFILAWIDTLARLKRYGSRIATWIFC